MKTRDIVVTLVALVAIGVTSFVAYRYEKKSETAGMCPFCRPHGAFCYRLPLKR